MRVLALKENPAHGQELSAVVKAMGHQIKVVASRKEAIDELPQSDYDLIISALHFKNDSAFDFLRIVKASESTREIPFIFCCMKPSRLTRTTFEGMEVAARALGADALILVDQYDDPRLKIFLRGLEKRLGSQDVHLPPSGQN